MTVVKPQTFTHSPLSDGWVLAEIHFGQCWHIALHVSFVPLDVAPWFSLLLPV